MSPYPAQLGYISSCWLYPDYISSYPYWFHLFHFHIHVIHVSYTYPTYPIKQETMSEVSRHGIRFGYAKTVLDFDPAHLMRSHFSEDDLYATHVYTQQEIQLKYGANAQTVDLAVLCTVHVTAPDHEIASRQEKANTLTFGLRLLLMCRISSCPSDASHRVERA